MNHYVIIPLSYIIKSGMYFFKWKLIYDWILQNTDIWIYFLHWNSLIAYTVYLMIA